MIIAVVLAALVIGLILGYAFRGTDPNQPDFDCPAVVLHYDCKGAGVCDHRKSTLYEAMATMARNAEQKAAAQQ